MVKFFSKTLLSVTGCILFAAAALAQNPTGTLAGHVTDGSLGLPGVTVTASSPQSAGHPDRHDLGRRRLHLQLPAAGRVQGQVRAAGLPDARDHGEAVRRADPGARRHDAPDTRRGGGDGRGIARDDLDRHERVHDLHQRSRQQAPDSTRPGELGSALPRGQLQRPGQRHHDLRGAVVREPLSWSTASWSTTTFADNRSTSTSRTRSRRPRPRPAAISAEYGRFAGGVVNTLTKSGGNDFHGSLRVDTSTTTSGPPSPRSP